MAHIDFLLNLDIMKIKIYIKNENLIFISILFVKILRFFKSNFL